MVQINSFLCPIGFVNAIEGLDIRGSFIDKGLVVKGNFGKIVTVVFAFVDRLVD